jgi:hypothetical protein
MFHTCALNYNIQQTNECALVKRTLLHINDHQHDFGCTCDHHLGVSKNTNKVYNILFICFYIYMYKPTLHYKGSTYDFNHSIKWFQPLQINILLYIVLVFFKTPR